LSTISGNENRLIQEIPESKFRLEQGLSLVCKYLAWPFAGMGEIDRKCFMATRDAGYQAAFGNFRAAIKSSQTD
jgi:hypothetical protein